MNSAFTIRDKTDVILSNIIGHEGGFTNDKSDVGGATIYGISSRFNPVYRDRIVNQTLTLDEAVAIYRNKYASQKLVQAARHWKMEYLCLDVVIWGLASLRSVQRALNTLFNENIRIDGRPGPQTMGLVSRVTTDEQVLTLASILYQNLESDARDLAQGGNANKLEGFRRRLMRRVATLFEDIQATFKIGSSYTLADMMNHASRQDAAPVGIYASATYAAYISKNLSRNKAYEYKEFIV